MQTSKYSGKHSAREWIAVIGITIVIWLIENGGYFFVATAAGMAQGGPSAALNLQAPLDRVIPWFTPIYALYIPLPIIWPVLFALIAFWMDGKRGFWRYNVISLIMYVVGTIIYAALPSVTIPSDFINGTIQTLPQNSMFYDQITALDSSPLNVFGSWPSYHNFWAGTSVLFGICGIAYGQKRHRKIGGVVCIIYGLLISLSTLVLHQHAFLDFVFTYAMIGLFYWLCVKFNLDKKLYKLLVGRELDAA
ncbi:MAG: phosphatase PAP2 family protein [Coriobacteriales bacterium]|jgi:membrane-associated phospholipid phosphatase|nr:phosphatase PAP2 family protein [Coriobacteriales bacterium]